MIVILGESASGKTTLLNNIINTNLGYKKIITYTTRPKRKNEHNGDDYHFCSKGVFDEYVKRDFFAIQDEYRDWKYGISKDDCKKENSIVIMTPSGLRELKKSGFDVVSIYLYVDRRSRLINILDRGDDIEEAYRRNLSEVGQFDGIVKEADYVIDNSFFHIDETQVLDVFLKIVDVISKEKNS